MANLINQISALYPLSTPNFQSTNSDSSTTDLISSFKDILSTMTMTGSGMSTGQQADAGISELITPLMMIILLEKLVEGQMEKDDVANTAQGSLLSLNPKSEPSGRPVGGVLTQDFHPGHNGLDFGVVVGTPVKATMDGKVTYAGWNDQGYGNLVIVENGAYKTYYAHLSSIPVSVGDGVAAGSTLGLSGNTGNSTGPHLHYEIRKNNVPIDPTSATLGT